MIDECCANSDRPSRHGQLLGEALAAIAEVGRCHGATEDCCLTCAFRPGTYPNQSASTGLLAFNCVLGLDKDVFVCHHGMKDGEPQRNCAGYAAGLLAPFDEVKAIVAKLYEDVIALDNAAPDAVRIAFDAWLAKADPNREMDVYQAARAYAKHMVPI